jgi:hypothetical protein
VLRQDSGMKTHAPHAFSSRPSCRPAGSPL